VTPVAQSTAWGGNGGVGELWLVAPFSEGEERAEDEDWDEATRS